MRPVVGATVFVALVTTIWCAPASADGGSLRLSATKGAYRIAVFITPTPFRAGVVDMSVLVQDASTGEPMSGIDVTVRMTKSGRHEIEVPATTEAATNKLFRAAQFDLPEPGHWKIEVRVDGSHGMALLGFEEEAADALPHWAEMWPWIGSPALVIALFLLHECLRGRRRS
jgi:hypothetical protein